jgi:hypothetical protein
VASSLSLLIALPTVSEEGLRGVVTKGRITFGIQGLWSGLYIFLPQRSPL